MTDIVDAIQKRKALLDAAKQLRAYSRARAEHASGNVSGDAEWLYSTFRVDCGRDGRVSFTIDCGYQMHSDAARIMGETLSKYIIPAAVDAVEIAEQRAAKYADEAVAEAQRVIDSVRGAK